MNCNFSAYEKSWLVLLGFLSSVLLETKIDCQKVPACQAGLALKQLFTMAGFFLTSLFP